MFGFISRTVGLLTGSAQALIAGQAGQRADIMNWIASVFNGQAANLASASLPDREGHVAAFLASQRHASPNPQPVQRQQAPTTR